MRCVEEKRKKSNIKYIPYMKNSKSMYNLILCLAKKCIVHVFSFNSKKQLRRALAHDKFKQKRNQTINEINNKKMSIKYGMCMNADKQHAKLQIPTKYRYIVYVVVP